MNVEMGFFLIQGKFPEWSIGNISREKHLKRLIGCWKSEAHEQELRLVAVRSDSGDVIDHLEVSGKAGKVFFLLNDLSLIHI